MTADDATSLITLTTDFGLADPYVAAMKGVILGLDPRASIVDVSHDVRPQAVRQAVFITQAAWPFFPPDAIHVAVVDPGVGTERRAIALIAPRGRFVGPDNGVLSAALPEDIRPPAGSEPAPASLPASFRAHEITNRRYMLDPVSGTFHGRDVFAPAAAHLSLGVPPQELGEPVAELLAEFEKNRAATIAAVETAGDELLRTPIRSAGGITGALASVIQAVAVLHIRGHVNDIVGG